jgi:DNA mismatch repair protein MutS
MLQLKKALAHIDPIKGHIQEALLDFGNDLGADVLRRYSDQLNPCHFLLEKIQKELRDEVPIVTNQGNMIREGVDAD